VRHSFPKFSRPADRHSARPVTDFGVLSHPFRVSVKVKYPR
jgi:hypothetical protein